MDNKTPVTLLQELLVKRQLIPTYNLTLDGTGSHDPMFQYEVTAAGACATGCGKSKKEAKHEAARVLLEKLGQQYDVKNEDTIDMNVNSPYAEVLKDNAVGMLSTYCAEKNLSLPEYDITRDEGLPHAKLFSYKCCVSSFTTEAQARTKKQAKQLAALEMLNKLKQCLQDIVLPAQPKEQSTNLEESSEMVLKLLMERRIKTGNSSEQLGIKIADYYKIFCDQAYPKSVLLESIKGYNRSWLEQQAELDEMCKGILEELDFPYRIELLPTKKKVGVCLTIDGTPTWAFFGEGGTENEAIRDVFLEALTFLIEMVNE